MAIPSLARPQSPHQPLSPASEPAAAPAPLWLCCHLPLLPLEALGLASDHPAAVVEDIKGRPHVLTASSAARTLGIFPGLSLHAAYVLCPQIGIESRCPELEQEVIEALAQRCLKFTPWVSLDYPRALLLEVRGSLNLYGGLETLQACLIDTITRSGYICRIAITPAPLASWLLASQGVSCTVMRREELRSALGDLPITALGLGADAPARLAKAGLRRLRDLWRLPRDGLARRYGAGLLEALDRAAGCTADAPRLYHSPPRFKARLELPLETDSLLHCSPAVEHLMKRLTAFLRSRDAAVAELRLLLHHGPAAPSVIRLELRQASREEAHLLGLLREKLERSPLPRPVRAVSLHAENLQPHVPQMADLFGTRAGERAGEWQQVVEMLQARLGRDAVRLLSALPDHRPERALSDSSHSSSAMPGGPRPMWLLPSPRPAAPDLKFLPGTERIESGWWDGEAVRRDYRVAFDRHGAKLWIYREPSHPERWYLHGLFG